MITIESFKRFNLIDLLLIILTAGLWFCLTSFITHVASPNMSYIFSLFIAAFLMSFTVNLVRKAGSATLFYLIGGIFTYLINDLGALRSTKLIALLFAGIVFETIFLILKLELKNIPLDIILGSALSAATIPITTGLLLSSTVSYSWLFELLNLSLLSFFIGVIGSVASFILWYNLRTTKIIMKYEYSRH